MDGTFLALLPFPLCATRKHLGFCAVFKLLWARRLSFGVGSGVLSKKKGGTSSAAKPNSVELAFDPVEAALRELFDDMAAEAVPEDFMQLIAKLSEEPPTAKKPRK